MNRLFALALAVPLVLATTARGDDLVAGNWKITSLAPNGVSELTYWLLKVETAGGKTTATLAAAHPLFKGPTIKSFTIKGDAVQAVLSNGFNDTTFEGKIAGKDGMKVVGVLGSGDFVYPAWMVPTEQTTIEKADLSKPAGAAGEGLAALTKLRIAKKGTAEADLLQWAESASKDAAVYGPAWTAIANASIATALLKHPEQKALAVKYAEAAERALDPASPPSRQIKVLEALAMALQATGKGDAAKSAIEKVARYDAVLDKAYLAEGLPFKPDVFAGRKADSKRAVVLELFTGAECPPCVAADLAFDGLLQTYKPTELVMIQYHVHIPGPDPLTNSETEARWKQYQAALPKFKLGGVPTAIVNGNKPRVGGGGRPNAEAAYKAYRDMIDPALETPAACQLTATAHRKGDTIDIQAQIAGLANASPDKKLRLVIVEDVVRHAGGNGIRMHHHVVRAMPGGIEGVAIADKDFQHKISIDLADRTKTLMAYLHNFVDMRGPFSRMIRPIEMHDMRLIAFVQDDATSEILQAVQVSVGEP